MNYEKIKDVKNFVKTNFNNVVETHHHVNDNSVKKSFFEQMYNLIIKNYHLINNHNIKSFNGLNYQMFNINDIFDYKKSNYPFNVMLSSDGIVNTINYNLNENLKTKLFFVFSNSNNINTINEIVLNEIRNLLIIKEILYNDINSFIKYHYYSDDGITAVYVDFSSFFDEKTTHYNIYADLIVGYDDQNNMCDLKLQSIILWEQYTTSFHKSDLPRGYSLQFLQRECSEKYKKYKLNYIPELTNIMALYRDMPCENEVIIKIKKNMIICL